MGNTANTFRILVTILVVSLAAAADGASSQGLTALRSFSDPAGSNPTAGLVQGSGGALHGTAGAGANGPYGIVFKLVGGCPSLTGSWSGPIQTCTSKPAGQHSKLSGTFVVQNIGCGSAPTSLVRYYLSNDDVFDAGRTSLKQVTISRLKAGKLKNSKLAVKLPTGSSASGRFIIAVIGADNPAPDCAGAT